MSDFLAAAGVMAILRYILQSSVTDQLSTALNATPIITALPPDRVTVGSAEVPQLNIFMYHVSLNQGWRNTALPSRDATGNRLTNPPLALDLHFLLSAYGKSEFDSEILLGWGMQVLNETPVLTGQLISATLQEMISPGPATAGGTPPPVPSELTAIATTTLPQQAEIIKVVPENISTEDIWKLWTAFQATYRATAAYCASVVLIRSLQPVRSSIPVQHRPNILVQPYQPPVIDNVSKGLLATGDVLTITGRNLIGKVPADTLVVFDTAAELAPGVAQDRVVRITLPPTIPAGARVVRIARNVTFGTPGDPHRGFYSNPASFMLVPTLTGTVPATVKPGTTLTLSVNPPVGSNQTTSVLIGGSAVTVNRPPPGAPATASSLNFAIPANFPVPTPAAPLPLRVQVDGAQSPITLDQNGLWQPSITVVAA
jgi:hypothetical protein